MLNDKMVVNSIECDIGTDAFSHHHNSPVIQEWALGNAMGLVQSLVNNVKKRVTEEPQEEEEAKKSDRKKKVNEKDEVKDEDDGEAAKVKRQKKA